MDTLCTVGKTLEFVISKVIYFYKYTAFVLHLSVPANAVWDVH